MMQLQSPPLPKPPNPLPHPPQKSKRRIMIQQLEEPFSPPQEHPPLHCVADKSLIGLPPKFHLHCYPMRVGLVYLHERLKNMQES